MLTRVLMFPFVVAVAVVWLVLGLVFAIPLIAKAVLFFTMELLIAAITQRRNSRRAGEGLRSALMFYPNGFRIIFATLTASDDEQSDESPWELSSGLLGPLFDTIRICLLAAAFWVTTTLFFHHAGIFHVDAVDRLERQLLAEIGIGERESLNGSGGDTCVVAAERANLRATATLEADNIVTELQRGARLRRTPDPIVGDDWISVQSESGLMGYVARSLLDCT